MSTRLSTRRGRLTTATSGPRAPSSSRATVRVPYRPRTHRRRRPTTTRWRPTPPRRQPPSRSSRTWNALHAEQCKQLKEQYDKLLHARRVYQANADSSAPKEYMTDAQADAERVKTRQAMDEACAAGSG